MRKIVSIAIIMVVALAARAQKVTFYSEVFEAGVRSHIGIGASEDVLQTQMDTITVLDLSGLAITDIRDAVYLTAITNLDLSYNKIRDVSPLLPLATLRTLDLSNNLLESINILAFIQAEEMEVDVANNYIGDFSYFYSPNLCSFTFWGMSMQLEKDAPYFDVNHFYVDVNEEDRCMVSYQGSTNMTATVYLSCGNSQTPVQFDGETHLVEVPENPAAGTEVILTGGEMSVKTYVVPTASFAAGASKTITMDPHLPEGYTLASAYASKGAVEIVSNTLRYTAPETAEPDVIHFSYYQGATLKGLSRYYLNRGNTLGDVNGDGNIDMADVLSILSYLLGEVLGDFGAAAADMNDDSIVTVTDALLLLDLIK